MILREIGFSFLRNEIIAYRLPGEERLILFYSLNFESEKLLEKIREDFSFGWEMVCSREDKIVRGKGKSWKR